MFSISFHYSTYFSSIFSLSFLIRPSLNIEYQ
jgi:hypothetical protein